MSDREAFEEAASRLGYRLKMADTWSGEYVYPESDTAWHLWQEACAWQAARVQGGEAVGWIRPSIEKGGFSFTADPSLAQTWARVGKQVEPVYTHPPKQQGGVPDGDLFEVLHEAVASMPKGIAEDDNDTPTEHILRAIKPFLSTPPSDKLEGEWGKCSDQVPAPGQSLGETVTAFWFASIAAGLSASRK